MRTSRPYRCVLADDHSVYRMGLRLLIERDGGEVVGEAGTGAETLEVVQRLLPDVLVLDVNMPDLMGPAVLAQLRAAGCTVPTLMLSAHDTEGYVLEAARAGAHGFVTKEHAPRRIVEAARQVAEGAHVWLVPLPAGSPLYTFTDREREILQLLAKGHSNEYIAETLCISVHTVRNHLTILYEKLGVTTAREAIARAWELRLVGI